MIDLLPFCLLRIATGSLQDLKELRINKDCFIELDRQQEQLFVFKDSLSDLLFNEINATKDDVLQKKLLNIKRSVFNLRDIQFSNLSITDYLHKQLLTYNELKTNLKNAQENAELVFKNASAEIRHKYKRILLNDNYQKGLILSSNDLLNNIQKYVAQDFARITAKELQCEYGSIKYATRMYAKTTPFSTFNKLAFVDIEDIENKEIRFLSSEKDTSCVNLNLQLYKILYSALLNTNGFRDHLHIKTNKAIFHQNEDLLLIQNKNNIDIVRSITSSELLIFIKEFLEKHSTVRQPDLYEALYEATGADINDLKKYIQQLIDTGFLLYDIPVDLTKPHWEKSLRDFVNQDQFTLFESQRTIVDSLNELHQQVTDFPDSTSVERYHLLNKIKKILIGIVTGLNQNAPESSLLKKKITEFPLTKLLYEDFTTNITSTLPKKEMLPLVTKLDSLLTELLALQEGTSGQTNLYHYFCYKHPDRDASPFIPFFKDFIADIKLPKDLRKNNYTDDGIPDFLKNNGINPESLKGTLDLSLWANTFVEHYKHRINTKEVHIELNEIRRINKTIGVTPQQVVPHSLGAFIQLYKNKNTYQCVLNTLVTGHGKMMSRFIPSFDKKYLLAIRKGNTFNKDSLLAEIGDASYFNANVHPPLSNYKVWSDGNNITPTKESEEISLNNIEIRADHTRKQVYLYDIKKQSPVSILDGGFQTPALRSSLYAFLSYFCNVQVTSPELIKQSINNKIGYDYALRNNALEILELPQIVFEQTIILQRKTWIIPIACIPVKDPFESEASYFRKINAWRIMQRIPEEVFLKKKMDRNELVSKLYEKDKGLVYEDYKPQYIHFSNPLLVNLFEKTLRGLENVLIKIEEMSPSAEQLLTLDQKPHVTELVIQWNRSN